MLKNRRSGYRGLQAFEAVSRHRSVSLAADELGITQSAVSHQIRQLSEDLGEKLIIRQGRGIALTRPASGWPRACNPPLPISAGRWPMS